MNMLLRTDAQISDLIEDVQAMPDTRELMINKVGGKGIRHPISVSDRDNIEQSTIGTFDMFVELPPNVKGTHMSRFVEILTDHENSITVTSFHQVLLAVTKRLGAERGYVHLAFPFFLKKKAPISGISSLMDYAVGFTGSINQGQASTTLSVVVPVTSLCPCSKQISNYGAHNQRSHVTLSLNANPNLHFTDLIELVEEEASCVLFGILKRPDEKFVTERAYDNPKFVEDLVRDIAARLTKEHRSTKFKVAAENFESIHNHSAYTEITR